jgi:NADH:ubiquinone oxidoreductase subunit F (NADH-binding)
LDQRRAHRPGGPSLLVVAAPPRYVAGETTAVVAYLAGQGALPRRARLPAAASGVGGRPTVVGNAETVAHLALIARRDPSWFSRYGGTGPDATVAGPTLVTLAGDVARPGTVIEVLGPTTVGEILARFGDRTGRPRAVLFGGYCGTWVDGLRAVRLPLERGALWRAGVPLGCGLVGVLGPEHCGLGETARLLGYLAGESAGQCGPCLLGLPLLHRVFVRTLGRRPTGRDLRRLRHLAASIEGRGACAMPDGAVRLLESALVVFGAEFSRHWASTACPCRTSDRPVCFPLPANADSRR